MRANVLTAGERCLTVLIPSLYLYSLAAAFCVRSGGLDAMRKPLGTWGFFLIVLFSQVGGYPVGAQLLHEQRLTGAITAAQERRLLCVCVGCGPGFLFGTVCQGMPPALRAWMLLSVSLPSLLIAIFLREPVGEIAAPPLQPFAGQLTQAAESAANAMLKVASMVLAFGGGMGILEGMGVLSHFSPFASGCIRSVLEVSCVTGWLRNGGTLPMAAAVLAFGGICVHFQLAAICEGNLNWMQFWLVRGICAALASGICQLGIQLFFQDVQMTALTETRTRLTQGSILPGLCLLLMSVMLLQKTHRQGERSDCARIADSKNA